MKQQDKKIFKERIKSFFPQATDSGVEQLMSLLINCCCIDLCSINNADDIQFTSLEVTGDTLSLTLTINGVPTTQSVVLPANIVTTMTNTVVGNLIGTYTNEVGVAVDINETITIIGTPTLINNILTIPFTNETGVTSNVIVDLSPLAVDISIQGIVYNPTTNTWIITQTDGSTSTITWNDILTDVDFCPAVKSCETVTTLINNGDGTATYTNESGGSITFPIGGVSVVDNGDGTYTITLADNSTVVIGDTSITNYADLTTLPKHQIGNYINEAGTIIPVYETVSFITPVVSGHGIATYQDETGATTTIQETITEYQDNTLTPNNIGRYRDEAGIFVDVNENLTSISNTIVGHKVADYTNELGTVVNIEETVTSIIDNGDGTITYTNENGVDTTISITDLLVTTTELFTVNAGTTNVSTDNSLGEQVITVGDILHFWSSNGSVNFNVQAGSVVTDFNTEASIIPYTPTSPITSTNVQDAIDELASNIHNPMTVTNTNTPYSFVSGTQTLNIPLSANLVDNGDGTITFTRGDGTAPITIAITEDAGEVLTTNPVVIVGTTYPTGTSVQAILNSLSGTAHVPVTTVDSGTIDFTQSGVDNQTVTATLVGATTATVGQVPTSDGSGGITWTSVGGGNEWLLNGNAGTDGGVTDFLGTTDDVPFVMKVNNFPVAKFYNSPYNYSVAFGYGSGSEVYGSNGFVANEANVIYSGEFSAAFNSGNAINSNNTFACGMSNSTVNSAGASFLAGASNIASGSLSFLSGVNNRSRSYAETVFGTNSIDYTAINAYNFDPADRLFVIGNGNVVTNSYNNALTLWKDGRAVMNTDATNTTPIQNTWFGINGTLSQNFNHIRTPNTLAAFSTEHTPSGNYAILGSNANNSGIAINNTKQFVFATTASTSATNLTATNTIGNYSNSGFLFGGGSVATSTIDVRGTLGLSNTRINTANPVLNTNNTVYHFTGGTSGTIDMTAHKVDNRTIVLTNYSGVSLTLSDAVRTGSATTITTLPDNTSIIVAYDGIEFFKIN